MNQPPPLGPPSPPLRGQGAMEYLLLIGGAVLVVTVILLLLLTSVLPQGNSILQHNLIHAQPTIPGFSTGTGNPPTYSGPLALDWSNINEWDYASFVFNNASAPYSANPPRVLSNITLTNVGTSPVTLTQTTPIFSITTPNAAALPLPTEIDSLDVFDSSNVFLFSLTDVSSGQTLPISLTLDPNDFVTLVIQFDQPVLPVYQNTFFYPAESVFSLRLEWRDTASVVHRPDSWNYFLVYEKGVSLGAPDASIQVCDGALGSSSGGSAGVITDWCVPDILPPFACVYTRDQGYSTLFSFPSSIPSTSTLLSSRFFMTQLDSVESGEGKYFDADDYALVKNSPSCAPAIFDNVPEDSSTAFSSTRNIVPIPLSETPGDIKYFDVGGVILPGENALSFSLAGDIPPVYSTDSEGWRQWQTGYENSLATPTPFLIVRFSVPV